MIETPITVQSPIKVDPMPPEIAKAIIEVMTKMGEGVSKDAENQYDNFKYASINAFLAATNRACAQAGLIIQAIQVGSETEQVEINSKTYNVMTFRYRFVLTHVSGATWHCPHDERTIRLQWKGAKTSGEAQAYVLKQYMRGLFQIATGEKDSDADEEMPTPDTAPRQQAASNRERKNAGKPMTSKFISLSFGGSEQEVPLADLSIRVPEYFAGLTKIQRNSWRSTNSLSLETLHGLDRTLWLSIQRMIDDGVPT